jgi:molybdenum cofactor biosynthesis enzyme
MTKLNHFNEAGEAHMVDVGDKQVTSRRAVAQGRIQMQAETLQRIIDGNHKKGDVLAVADCRYHGCKENSRAGSPVSPHCAHAY